MTQNFKHTPKSPGQFSQIVTLTPTAQTTMGVSEKPPITQIASDGTLSLRKTTATPQRDSRSLATIISAETPVGTDRLRGVLSWPRLIL